jgi:hypothetical protein
MKKINVVVKAGDIFNSQPVFSRLNSSKIKSATYALFFALNVEQLHPLFVEVESKRVDLVRQYGQLNEEAGQVVVKPEDIESFSADFSELMKSELSVDLYKFDADMLEVMFNGTDVTGEDMATIKYMVNYD